MKLSRRDQTGQALIETILIGLLLLAPLLWVLSVLADVHRSALASTAAAREAGRNAAAAAGVVGARDAVNSAVRQAFIDHGLDPGPARVQWTSSHGLERGGSVEVEVSYPVTVLSVPFLGRVGGPSIYVRARHIARVGPYRSRAP